MALGRASVQQGFDDPRVLVGDQLREGSLYRLLADHGHQMFPDGYFAGLFTESAKGRPTVAAQVLATVMLLQAFEGLSDREACDRLEVDLRWQAAAGVDAGPQLDLLKSLASTVSDFQKSLAAIDKSLAHHADGDAYAHAKYFRDAVLPAMVEARKQGDKLETLVADDLWPLPTYREMLFIR